MSDRILDMQARLAGARQVERELQGLESQTKKVESAAASAAGGEKGLADALRERSEAAGKALESTEKTFAVTDRLQSIVGKVTGVLGLATLAIGAVTAAYQALTPEVDLLSTSLDEQVRRAKAAEAALKSLATVQGSGRFVRPDDLVAEVKATRDLSEAQAERLLLAQQQLEAQDALEEAGRRLAAVNTDIATSEDDKARALQGFLARTGELNSRIVAFRDAQVEAANREADAETRLLRLRQEAHRDAAAGLATVPFEPTAGVAAAGPAGPRGGRAQQAPRDPGLSFPQLNSEFIAGLKLPGGEDPFGGPERISEAQDLADGIANVVGQLEQLQSAELAVAEARKQGTAVALGYAEAAAKAGAAAALSAALRGESVAEAVNAVLQGVAVEATVEAAFEVAKGLAALANPLTAPTAAGHFAAAKAFGVTAAIAGVGAVATGGFGGGGASSPADVSPPGGPRGESAFGRERGGGGDTYIMNNNLDLRTRPLATNRELARELARTQADFARLPGSGRR